MRLTCKVKFGGNSIDSIQAKGDHLLVIHVSAR